MFNDLTCERTFCMDCKLVVSSFFNVILCYRTRLFRIGNENWFPFDESPHFIIKSGENVVSRAEIKISFDMSPENRSLKALDTAHSLNRALGWRKVATLHMTSSTPTTKVNMLNKNKLSTIKNNTRSFFCEDFPIPILWKMETRRDTSVTFVTSKHGFAH